MIYKIVAMSSTKTGAAVEFVVEILEREGSAWVRAASNSMWPLIQAGDELRLRALDPAGARPGAIIAYRRQGMLIVHRLLRVTPAGFVTTGDALNDSEAPVSARSLVGCVVAIRPPGRRTLDLSRFPWPQIGGMLAVLARVQRAVPFAWKPLRIPFYLAAWLGR